MLFAGSGGQGILTAGNILANAAMLDDFFVTYLPSYGAAMRGGTANCSICISDEEIASPVTSAPEFVIAMNQPSVLSFVNRLDPGGELMYNCDLVDTVPYRGDIEMFPVPANNISIGLGNGRAANMVMLGAFLKLINIVKVGTVNKSIEDMMSSRKKLIDLSIKAVAAGYDGFPFDVMK